MGGRKTAIMNNQLNIFGENNLLPFDGEAYLYDNFFAAEESDQLLEQLQTTISWKQDYIKMYGKQLPLPRLTAWYGDEGKTYAYSGIINIPLPFNTCLAAIKERVEAFTKHRFNAALLNFYRHEKDGMGWHSDDEKELGSNPVIASFSFGGSRNFQFKHKTEKKSTITITLNHGSLLLMKGSAQHHWLHQLPKTSKAIAPRINITFRQIQ